MGWKQETPEDGHNFISRCIPLQAFSKRVKLSMQLCTILRGLCYLQVVLDKILTRDLQVSSLDDYLGQAVLLRPVHNYHSPFMINDRNATRHADDCASLLVIGWILRRFSSKDLCVFLCDCNHP